MAKKAETREKSTTDVLMKAIKQKYGNVINPMSESADNIQTVSTGSLGLDLALGRGGMALGRVYEVFGPNSSGKSTLGVHVVIQAQRRGLKCAYIDAEMAVDPKLFENYGVDADKLTMIKAYGGEPNLDICERLIQTGEYSVIVIDSVSALIPLAEAQADIDKDQMALQARLMSKALRKLTPQAAENDTLLIFVNQTRVKVGGYGDPTVTTGGESLNFWATGRIKVQGPESKKRRLVDPITSDTYGHTTIFEIVKNKLGEPFKKTELNLLYGKGYDHIQEVLTMAVSLNLVEKAGSWFKYKGENIGQGELNTLDKLREDKELFKELETTIIEMTGLKDAYEQHSNGGPRRADTPVPKQAV
jgi:recombination protein RecA